jgi:type IV secretory pathway VirB2 component (pilin)
LLPNPSEASYVEKRAEWCTRYVINPEIERITSLIITNDDTGKPISGISHELDKVRLSEPYKKLKNEDKNLEDYKNNLSKKGHADFESNEKERENKRNEANNKQKELKKEMENKEKGLATALGEFNAYYGFLRNKAAALGYETLKIKTGHVNVDTLCVGAECGIDIFENPESGKESLINRIIGIMAGVAGTLGVLLLVIAGAMMVASRGDEDMLSKAKKTFGMTIFGLILIFSAYIIVQLIISVLFTLDQ